MTFRFLHLADVHLDSAYGGSQATVRRLRAASMEAFEAACQLAAGENLDALVLAGDAFDDERLGYDARAFFRRSLMGLSRSGVSVVYVTGNHDPGSRTAHAASLGLSDPGSEGAPIHVVTGPEPRRIEIRSAGGDVVAEVLAAGHSGPRVTANLARPFARGSQRGLPVIGVLHTQVTTAAGASGHEPYAPCTVADLAAADLDYWALGHVHVRGRVDPSVPAYYPGNLQGRNAREHGPKGGLLVEVDAHGLVHEPEFLAFSPVEFFRCAGTLGARATPEDVAELVTRSLERAAPLDTGPRASELVVRCDIGGAFGHELRRLGPQGQAAEFQEAALGELNVRGGAVTVQGLELRPAAPVPEAGPAPGSPDPWRARLTSSPSALGRALALCDELERAPGTARRWVPDATFAGRVDALLQSGDAGPVAGLGEELLSRIRAGGAR